MASTRYTVIHHFDVWGNAEDGWEVNDSSHAGEIIVPDEVEDAQVWDALVSAGIARGPSAQAEMLWTGDAIEINDAHDGSRPLFTLWIED